MAQRAPLRPAIEPVRPNRIPPHNLDAEQSVLGAMLESREAIANVIEILRTEDFYKPAHAEIYESVLALFARGEAVDAITVADELARRGALDQIGGKPYIHGLLEAYPTASSAGHYARIVEEHSLLRRMIEAGGRIQEIGFAMPEDVEAAVDEAEELVYQVGDRRLHDDVLPVKGLLMDTMAHIEIINERKEFTGVASGFPDLDDMTTGFQPSQLIIVASRPSQGKSSLLSDFALSAAVRQGKPVVIFSLEMGRLEIVQRFLSSEARVDQQRIRKGSLQEADWAKLSAALGRLGEAPIFIDDAANVNMMEIRAKCRRLKAKHNLGLVIIDYLQLMQSPRKSENRQQEVSEISRALKILSRELEVPVICASQLNRAVEYRSDKRPMLGDLRESGCLTGDTRVLRADTNAPVTLRELLATGEWNIPVWTLDENYRMVCGTMTHVFPSGRKPVYRLKMRSGREVKASPNHPFLSFDGWKRLDELQVGDKLAVPRRIPDPMKVGTWDREKLILLAHLIGDGSFLKGKPLRYATTSKENLEAVVNAAKAFGVTARTNWEVAARSFQVFLPAPFHLTHGHRNPIVKWLDELGIYDKRSHEKFVPEEVLGLSEDQIGVFLAHLWATDGFVGFEKGGKSDQATIYYATNSRRLAEDVVYLLLRLAIQTHITITRKAGYRDGYHVNIAGGESQRRFLTRVGAFGPKAKGGIQATLKLSRSRARTSHVDSIPSQAWNRVRPHVRQAGARALERRSGVVFARSLTRNAPMPRPVAEGLGVLLEGDALKNPGTSDVVWDEVRTVEFIGEEDVYDATVLKSHNFVSNGIICHNSIEQDSDVVMFIYRDEVYNPDTDRKGEAELIVAKQRNGPTGSVNLAFMNQYTKFASIARGTSI